MASCSLDRTFHPKEVRYISDGMGRDSYISQPNGNYFALPLGKIGEKIPYLSSTMIIHDREGPKFQPR